ncbi:MAG: DUF4340 domain-containing protein [Pseudomonadales bacterium]|nr:DUF4340 domain-containing protein [Pseudomonadales bacterium]MCP5189704.1 DUF4340 domain-containing protein [Pseudomonadales bacterium]
MNRWLAAGSLLLAGQCALVIALYWPQVFDPPEVGAPQFSSFTPDAVDEIYVGDEYDNETLLLRAGQRWLLPELENLPADGDMVAKLLQALTRGDTTWPVAESVAARQRFQVANYYYQRRVQLLGEGEVLGTFLLGTSPGFRKIHVRNASQDAIYTIAFNAFDAPGHSGAWLDRRLLQVRTPLSITADSYSLHWQDGQWRSGMGRQPDERELEALLAALRNLQVDGIADGDRQRDLAQAEAELVLQVESLGASVSLELFTLGGHHYIFSSEYPLFFTISAYDYERLTDIDFRLISGERMRDGQ